MPIPKREGPGRPLTCQCNTWGCITCMSRFVWNARKYRYPKKKPQTKEQISQEILDNLGK